MQERVTKKYRLGFETIDCPHDEYGDYAVKTSTPPEKGPPPLVNFQREIIDI
jgi:hypothetical protein